MRAFLSAALILMMGALWVGCSDDTKYQAEFRGTWNLESRKSPQGQEIKAPTISGLLEWFPLTQDRAHVLLMVTDDRNAIQLLDGVYTLQDNTFNRHAHVRIGGVLGSEIQETFETTPSKSTGKIASEDARATLLHDDGTQFEFIGAQLTITYSNGTVDLWKRQKDQKGTLAN